MEIFFWLHSMNVMMNMNLKYPKLIVYIVVKKIGLVHVQFVLLLNTMKMKMMKMMVSVCVNIVIM